MSDLNLLPPNSTLLEKNTAELTKRVSNIQTPYIALYHYDLCPVPFLPWLAWDQRVEFWDSNWTESKKRTAIATAKPYNKQRGTRASLQRALNQFGAGWQLKTWYEYTPKRNPFTFYLKNPTTPRITIEDLQILETSIDATKSARDFYLVEATIVTRAVQFVRATAHSVDRIRISMPDSSALFRCTQFVRGTVHSVDHIHIASQEAA